MMPCFEGMRVLLVALEEGPVVREEDVRVVVVFAAKGQYLHPERVTHPPVGSLNCTFALQVNCMVISLRFIDDVKLSSTFPERYAGFISLPCPRMTK